MIKFLIHIWWLCLIFPSSVIALNESTKPSTINVFLEENPPFSGFNLQKQAQGIYVDYWKQWSVNAGITINFLPSLKNDIVGSLNENKPSVFSGMDINKSSLSEPLLTKNDLVQIEAHYYYISANQSDLKERIIDKNKAIIVGGLLSGAQKLPELADRENLVYKAFPGLLEALISLYYNEIDAVVLFTAKDSKETWITNTLSYFLKSNVSVNSSNALYYYSTQNQKELLEWIEWGKQGLAEYMINQPLVKHSTAYWGVSIVMARNLTTVALVILILIWLTISKRKKDRKFKSILDSAPYPLAVISLTGHKIFYLNDAVKLLFSFKKSNNKYFFEVEENQRILASFVKELSHQNAIETSITRLIVNKNFHDIEISAKRVHYKRTSAWLCYLKDVTELREAEKSLLEERSLLRTVLDSIPEQISYKASDGTIIGCNNSWASAHGTSVNKATGGLYASFINKKQSEVQVQQDKLVWQGKKFSTQDWIEKGGKSPRLVSITKVPLPDNNGGILGVLSVESDITDVHDLTKQLKNENEQLIETKNELSKQKVLLKTIFEETADPIVVLDQKNRIIDANQAFAMLIGINKTKLSGTLISELKLIEGEWLLRQNQAILSSSDRVKFDELIQHNSRNSWYEVHKVAFDDINSNSKGIIVMAKAITKSDKTLKQNKKTNLHLLEADTLTKIPGRDAFDLHFDEMWHESQKQNEMMSTVICDVDDFEEFSESQGSPKGDIVLQQFVHLLGSAAKEVSCFVARYEHDKFIFIFKGGNATKALKTAEKIFEIAHEVSFEGNLLTLSMGLSCIFPSDINNKKMLIAEGLLAIKEAQFSGGNQIGVH